LREVRVERADAARVLDRNELPPPVRPADEDDPAGCRRADRRAERSRKVDAGVEPVASRPKALAEGGVQRPREGDGRARQRPAERSPARCWQRRTARFVAGPSIPSTVAPYSPWRRSAT